MNLLKYLIIGSLVLGSSLTYAEYYRYIDESGAVRFTDDLGQVPKEQRTEIREYQSYKTQEPAKEEIQQEPVMQNPVSEFAQELEKLNVRKSEIENEFDSLMKIRESLDKEKETVKTNDEIKAYNQKVLDLNEKINQYEAKRKIFDEDIKAYNEKVREARKKMEEAQMAPKDTIEDEKKEEPASK